MNATDLRARNQRHALVLTVALTLVVFASAWNAHYPEDWLLENWLVFAAIAALAVGWHSAPLSRGAYNAIFVFLCLHELGAHYTYSEVPYDAWAGAITGHTVSELMGWERNHYDRLVHLTYGLLLVLPFREVLLRGAKISGKAWSCVLPVTFTMATSVVYELIEWGAAVLFAGDLGMAYLGTQGDLWDGHKDMALASAGACLTMLAYAATQWTHVASRSPSRDRRGGRR